MKLAQLYTHEHKWFCSELARLGGPGVMRSGLIPWRIREGVVVNYFSKRLRVAIICTPHGTKNEFEKLPSQLTRRSFKTLFVKPFSTDSLAEAVSEVLQSQRILAERGYAGFLIHRQLELGAISRRRRAKFLPVKSLDPVKYLEEKRQRLEKDVLLPRGATAPASKTSLDSVSFQVGQQQTRNNLQAAEARKKSRLNLLRQIEQERKALSRVAASRPDQSEEVAPDSPAFTGTHIVSV
jgi:hypothetical protein